MTIFAKDAKLPLGGSNSLYFYHRKATDLCYQFAGFIQSFMHFYLLKANTATNINVFLHLRERETFHIQWKEVSCCLKQHGTPVKCLRHMK